jgi:serine/threonine-protein phosphatase 6 regulatory ankyrin repeat subunit A/serine/threonine-protein phosphatase 6 regulatory ankyrin repeat subunit B
MESLLFQAVKEGNEGEVARLLDDDPALLEKAGHEGVTAFLLAAMHGQLGVMQLLIQRGAYANAPASDSGDTALHLAAWEGQEQAAAFLLGQGAQSTHRGKDGATPLILACDKGHLGVLRMLVHHLGKQELEATDKEGLTALHYAALCGNEECVSFLLGQGAQANSKSKNGTTPFMMACDNGQIAVMKVLLEHVGPQALQETDIQGMTALHLAAESGHEETVTYLLGQGAQANSKAEDGTTPFIMACEAGHMGVVQVLLEHAGPEAFQETDNQGLTALHYAASCGKEEIVSFLLGQGAQADSRDEDDTAPFMMACKEGWVGVARVLLQHVGLQALQETDGDGRTAIHYAAYRGHGDIVTFLLGQGAQANSRDQSGATPFMMACDKGYMSVVQLLLEHVGLQVLQETDEEGWTSLHYAAFWGHEETVTFMLGQGAQANSKDEDGCTPFMKACQTGRTGVVHLLLQHMGPQAMQETDNNGVTALHFAVFEDHEETAAFLISQGAECSSRTAGVAGTPFVLACGKGRLGVARLLLQHMGPEALQERDEHGMTPLHWACEKGRGEVVRFLLLSGADPTITDHQGRTPRDIAEMEEEEEDEDEDEEEEEEKEKKGSRAGCVAAFEVRKPHVVAHTYLGWPTHIPSP